MSNSYRKTPIVGITTAESDKRYKKAEHSRERAAAKIALAHGNEPQDSRAYGNPWRSEKDGKLYCPEYKDYLRK